MAMVGARLDDEIDQGSADDAANKYVNVYEHCTCLINMFLGLMLTMMSMTKRYIRIIMILFLYYLLTIIFQREEVANFDTKQIETQITQR